MTPGMEGWEFRHEQKQDTELADIPVISLSAVGKLVDVDVVLRKPVDYDELVMAVERYVTGPVGRHRRVQAKSERSHVSHHSKSRRK